MPRHWDPENLTLNK
ncbi:hypothetical protein NOX90_00570 [Wolbachia endosymbiont of Anurida maritima]